MGGRPAHSSPDASSLPVQDLASEPSLYPHSLQSPQTLSGAHHPQPQTKEAAAPTPDLLLSCRMRLFY